MKKQEKSTATELTYWLDELRASDREFEDYLDRCDKIEQRYRDDRKTTTKNQARFNIFWANNQVLQPATFSSTPKIAVERTFKDKDRVGRLACQILERNTQKQLDDQDFEGAMKSARDEFLQYGRSSARVRYDVKMGQEIQRVPVQQNIDPQTGQPLEPQYVLMDGAPVDPKLVKNDNGFFFIESGYDVVQEERSEVVFVPSDLFRHQAVRLWPEVRWVSFDSYMTRKELVDRFGDELGSAIPLTVNSKGQKPGKKTVESSRCRHAKITEIWDMEASEVLWVCEAYAKDFLDRQPDPLKLRKFFPFAKPAYGTMTTKSLIPVPDYAQYQDLCEELDTCTTRISRLTKALKVAGVYDATIKEMARLYDEGVDTKLIATNAFKSLAEKGGLEKSVMFLPIEQVAAVLKGLYDIRDRIVQAIYEITGISDVIRGQSDPRETFGAQGIKARSFSSRIGEKQREFERFVRDTVRLVAEVVAEHFDKQTLFDVTGTDITSEYSPEEFEAAASLLKSDRLRSFRIDIETTSMIAMDEEAEKAGATEYVQAVTPLLKEFIPIITSLPQSAEYLTETLMMVARRFKAGRGTEGALERFMESMVELAQNPPPQPQEPPPPPDHEPERIAMERETKMADLQIKATDLASRMQLEREKLGVESTLEKEKNQLTAALKTAEIELKKTAMALDYEKALREELQKKVDSDRNAMVNLAAIAQKSEQAKAAAERPAAEG